MQSYTEKLKALEDRTVEFSVNTIKTCGPYSKDFALRPLVDQLIRSATSVGANYAEANNASSKADFRSKVYISKKEAAESVYWFRVLHELTQNDDLLSLQQEARELNLIFQKIVSTIKVDAANGK